MDPSFDLSEHGVTAARVLRNASVPHLYEHAVRAGDRLTSVGALATASGEKTGRSPKDKRIVDHPDSRADVWWGKVNIKLSDASFAANRRAAIEFLSAREQLYVFDGFAGWDPRRQLKIRVICARPYHALFMHNMLIRPTPKQLATFGKPDFVIYNAGQAAADPRVPGNTSKTSIDLNFEDSEMVILGTQYAGEMKKGVFTIMNYLMPKQGILPMHCSANEGKRGDVSLFFGLSGTGKTTLSADVRRRLIGDDEHCWSDDGIYNIEGGCYAKCIHLSAEKEPEIFAAIRFGTVLENVVMDEDTRVVDYEDARLTENTRASYPIEFMPQAKIPCLGGHPANVIFLTADAFGVLPPVSKLTPAQAMYHFLNGYTAKVAGTEVGVTDPEATFSACFGAAFLVWHPTKYAEAVAQRMRAFGAQAWLVNTGWTGGSFGTGKRISLAHTRAIIDAIHAGSLSNAYTTEDPVFGLAVPTHVPDVPSEILMPQNTWPDPEAYELTAKKLARLFQENFEQYTDAASDEIKSAGPRVPEVARR